MDFKLLVSIWMQIMMLYFCWKISEWWAFGAFDNFETDEKREIDNLFLMHSAPNLLSRYMRLLRPYYFFIYIREGAYNFLRFNFIR